MIIPNQTYNEGLGLHRKIRENDVYIVSGVLHTHAVDERHYFIFETLASALEKITHIVDGKNDLWYNVWIDRESRKVISHSFIKRNSPDANIWDPYGLIDTF